MKDIERSKAITGILRKNAYDEDAGAKEAELGAYVNKAGKAYIPADQIQESLTRAGTQVRVGGQGKKTYKDFMKSYVFLEPDEISLTPDKWEVDKRYVRVQGSGIMRYRPIYKNWAAKFRITLTDDTIPVNTVKEILEIAGMRIGIGDYRPKYGLFSVETFDEVTMKK